MLPDVWVLNVNNYIACKILKIGDSVIFAERIYLVIFTYLCLKLL